MRWGAELKVYIANFGLENFEWPRCLSGGYVATMQDERVHPFWEAGDRQGYIDFCVANLTTARGVAPTRAVASRWYNLATIIVESEGDLWLHRQGDRLWWTITTSEPASITLGPDLKPLPNSAENVFYYRKPAQPWSNRNKLGAALKWRGLHPKAPDFLMTEATLQQLGPDYAGYALALIEGADLSNWHDRAEWRTKTETGSRRQPVNFFGTKQVTFFEMADRAWSTTLTANGQQVLRRVKNKDFGFTDRHQLADYIAGLYDAQEGLCAITGLTLQFKGGDDHELCCSLDRIDSNGHYKPGNLQVVCKFINRWKSDSDDSEFRRLTELVRQSPGF